MRDHPIIFSGAMVRALLDGRKTQTRRLAWRVAPAAVRFDDPSAGLTPGTPSPWQRVEVGDRLWVRENYWHAPVEAGFDSTGGCRGTLVYSADPGMTADAEERARARGIKQRPSIHMPRWASRLTLTVAEVRLQHLQEISEADAVAEGLRRKEGGYRPGTRGDHIGTFAHLWDSLHGAGAWDANPAVIALTFNVAHHNIDAPATAAQAPDAGSNA